MPPFVDSNSTVRSETTTSLSLNQRATGIQALIAKIRADIDAGDFTQAGELARLQAQIDQANTAAAGVSRKQDEEDDVDDDKDVPGTYNPVEYANL